jgi:hypothetical protein
MKLNLLVRMDVNGGNPAVVDTVQAACGAGNNVVDDVYAGKNVATRFPMISKLHKSDTNK